MYVIKDAHECEIRPTDRDDYSTKKERQTRNNQKEKKKREEARTVFRYVREEKQATQRVHHFSVPLKKKKCIFCQCVFFIPYVSNEIFTFFFFFLRFLQQRSRLVN